MTCLAAAQASAQSFTDADADVAFRVGDVAFLGDAPDALTLGAGAFNIITNDDLAGTAGELRLEYRFGEKWYAIGPMLGALVNTEGGLFGYAALYTDMRLGEHWTITPAAGIGAYERGDGKDLGGVFQFHLGLDVAYRLQNGSRLGVKLTHISNASIHDDNPGTESLLLTYTVPLGR